MPEHRLLNTGSTIRQAKGHVACDVGDEVVLLSITNGEYYAFNATASLLWRGLQPDAPRSIASLLDREMQGFDVEPERAAREVLAILQSLLDEGLIEVDV